MIILLFLILCILLLSVLSFLVKSKSKSKSEKEGMEDDYLSLAIDSIQSASQDPTMNSDRKIALEDALRYANYIKNIDTI
jgi:hypothetical protein